MTVRPVVDGIERQFEADLTVIRLNLQEPAGRSLAASFGVQFTPTFLLFDPAGVEVWRSVYRIDPQIVGAHLGLP